MCYCPTPTLHLNLALTGDGAFLFSLKKTHSVWFLSVLNYGDTENVLINHLLLVIPMSYPCYYTNLCPHKPHKHAHTHTHTHAHTHTKLPTGFIELAPKYEPVLDQYSVLKWDISSAAVCIVLSINESIAALYEWTHSDCVISSRTRSYFHSERARMQERDFPSHTYMS